MLSHFLCLGMSHVVNKAWQSPSLEHTIAVSSPHIQSGVENNSICVSAHFHVLVTLQTSTTNIPKALYKRHENRQITASEGSKNRKTTYKLLRRGVTFITQVSYHFPTNTELIACNNTREANTAHIPANQEHTPCLAEKWATWLSCSTRRCRASINSSSLSYNIT